MSKSSEKWLSDYETIERLVQTISKNLNERIKYPSSSSNYNKLSVSCRTLISKLNSNIINLEKSLNEASQQGNLTQMEINRRTTLINQLKTNEKQFDQMLRNEKSAQKDQLFSNLHSSEILTSNLTETNETMSYSTDQLLMQQDRALLDQDRGLDTLANVIRNQKQIATTIGNEVERQNVLIDTMGGKIDGLNERLINETKRIRFIDRKSTTCGVWFVIVILLIAIIVIVAIPV